MGWGGGDFFDLAAAVLRKCQPLLLKGSNIPSVFGRIQMTLIYPPSLKHVFQGDTKDATERTFANNAAQQNSGEKWEGSMSSISLRLC